eukprot:5192842-Prorocentrum_lima.AAC.1
MQISRSWVIGFWSAPSPRAVAIASNRQECSNMPACLTSNSGPPVGRYPLGCRHRTEGRAPRTATKRSSHISLRTIQGSQGS